MNVNFESYRKIFVTFGIFLDIYINYSSIYKVRGKIWKKK